MNKSGGLAINVVPILTKTGAQPPRGFEIFVAVGPSRGEGRLPTERRLPIVSVRGPPLRDLFDLVFASRWISFVLLRGYRSARNKLPIDTGIPLIKRALNISATAMPKSHRVGLVDLARRKSGR